MTRQYASADEANSSRDCSPRMCSTLPIPPFTNWNECWSSPALEQVGPEDDEEEEDSTPEPPSYTEDEDCAVKSPADSPLRASFRITRDRQMSTESINTTPFRDIPGFRRRQSLARGSFSAAAEYRRSSVARRISSVSGRGNAFNSFVTAERPALRRASTSTSAVMERQPTRKVSITRPTYVAPPEKAVKMRRESVLEKLEIEQTLSRSASPSMTYNPIVVPRRAVDSPSFKSQGYWTANDASDTATTSRESSFEPAVPQIAISPDRRQRREDDNMSEDGAEEDDTVEHNSMQLATARRVSLADSGQSLPFFLKASRITTDEAAASRRSSAAFTTWSEQHAADQQAQHGGGGAYRRGSHRPSDIVSVVTALQSNHLQETRRLNELIALLSTKVATLENELLHGKRADAHAGSRGGTSPLPSPPDSGKCGEDVPDDDGAEDDDDDGSPPWRHYRLERAHRPHEPAADRRDSQQQQQPGLGHRLSDGGGAHAHHLSSSPRTAPRQHRVSVGFVPVVVPLSI